MSPADPVTTSIAVGVIVAVDEYSLKLLASLSVRVIFDDIRLTGIAIVPLASEVFRAETTQYATPSQGFVVVDPTILTMYR